MISIQCDENVKRAILNGLKARAIIAYSVEEENLKGASDEKIFEYCISNNRVLLTNDDDFFRLANKSNHSGIIFIKTQFAAIGDIIMSIVKLADTRSEKDFENAIFFVP